MAITLESPVRSLMGPGFLAPVPSIPPDSGLTHPVSRQPSLPSQGPALSSPYSQPLPGPPPVSSFSFHLHPFSSPLLTPPISTPPASVIKEPDWSGCHAASFPTIWAQKPNRQLSD